MASNRVRKRVRFDLPPSNEPSDDEPSQHNIPIDPRLLAISPHQPTQPSRKPRKRLILTGPRLPGPTAQAELVTQRGPGGLHYQTTVYGGEEFQAEPRTFEKEEFSDEEFNPKRRRYKKEDHPDEEYKPAPTHRTKYLKQEGLSNKDYSEPIGNHHLRQLKYSDPASVDDQSSLTNGNEMTEPRARAARHKGQLNFQSEIKSMLYAYGDSPAPLSETVRLMDEIVTDFIIETCHLAARSAQLCKRQKIKLEDFNFAIKGDEVMLGRVKEMLSTDKQIRDMRKQFDTEEGKVGLERGGRKKKGGEEAEKDTDKDGEKEKEG